MIIVEGSDNSGKTTLIRKLAEEFSLLTPLKGRGPENNYAFWIESLRWSPADLTRAIWDRFYFSELAYGTAIREKVRLTRQQKEVIESLMVAADPLIIHCHLIPDEELFNTKEQLFSWEQNKAVANFYPGILEGWRALEYDPLTTPLEEVLTTVAKYLGSRRPWLGFRQVCPYGRGNFHRPRLMVVGEKFGPNNPLGIPMERSKTGVMIHNALRRNQLSMSDVWITNALKYEGDLTTENLREMSAEYRLIQPKGIIALGRKAKGILSALRIPHLHVGHPAYYMRKGKEELFGTEFTAAWKTILEEEDKNNESD